MGFSIRLWAFHHSINGVKYSIGHREQRYPLNGRNCNQLMVVRIDREVTFKISCHVSDNDGGVEDAYYERHESHFADKLRSLYPDIPADEVAKKFTEILEIANASHRCPNYTTGGFTTSHIVVFDIRPNRPRSRHNDELEVPEYILREKTDVGLEDLVYPMLRPATRASVIELLNSPTVLESGCGICLEDIVSCSSKAVRMPCSHSFHRICLVQWLNTNHSCPMCRYQIPAAQYRSDLLHERQSVRPFQHPNPQQPMPD